MEVGVIINSIGICWLIYHYNDFIDEFNFILKNFKRILREGGISVIQRYRFGRDIKGACGQFSLEK